MKPSMVKSGMKNTNWFNWSRYCRDRSIACSKQEFDFLKIGNTKGQFVVAHKNGLKHFETNERNQNGIKGP